MTEVDLLELDPVVSWTLRLGLAALLATAALHKLADAGGFRRALAGYGLPGSLIAPVARTAVALELALAGALLAPSLAAAAAFASALLFIAYSAVVASALARGRTSIACGCGGPGGERPVSAALLGRNGALILGCALAAAPVSTRAAGALDLGTIVLATAALAIVYACADVAMANAARASAAVRG